MDYNRDEWKQMFPDEPYPKDMSDQEMDYILSMIEPPKEIKEE